MAVSIGSRRARLNSCVLVSALTTHRTGRALRRIRPLNPSRLLVASLCLCLISLMSACSDSGLNTDSTDRATTVPVPTKVIPDGVLENPIDTTSFINTVDATNESGMGASVAPDSSSESSTGSLTDEAVLANRLQTAFYLDGQRLVPTTGWICKDVFEENRIYYFYPAGVLDAVRMVAIERSLIADNEFNDVRFFWSVSAADSLLLSATVLGSDGALFSSGQQYDMTTIRFTEVDSVASFTAQSLLRGKLVCAVFDLQ